MISYPGNPYKLASIRMSRARPGSEPPLTTIDDFPVRWVVTVMSKCQTAFGSSPSRPDGSVAKVKLPLGGRWRKRAPVYSDWIQRSPSKTVAPGSDRVP